MPIPTRSTGVLAVLFVLAASVHAEDAKTVKKKIQDLTLEVPATWEQSEPSSRLRLAQFAIPSADGVTVPTELVVYSFAGGGGGVDPNLTRWLGQFASEGRKFGFKSGKSEIGEYVIASITGTYNMPVGPPILRKTKKLADGQMLAAIITIEGKGVYFLKMAGPAKTVTAAAKGFRASFGADASKEKKYEIK